MYAQAVHLTAPLSWEKEAKQLTFTSNLSTVMPTFNFSFDPGTSLQQMIGFEMAGRIWSSYLTDNATINLHVGVSKGLTSNIIGGALPGMSSNQNYKDVRQQLVADAKSADDFSAMNTLANSQKDKFDARFDLLDDKTRANRGTNANTNKLNLTRANAKAIGMPVSGNSSALDGYILFSDLSSSPYQWSYDYTRSSAASPTTLDFLTTAVHEIAHVLGFVSGVDQPGWLYAFSTDKQQQDAYKKSLDARIAGATPLDLFRYSAQGTSTDKNGVTTTVYQSDFSYGSGGGAKYFSIDGKTAIAQFSTGADSTLTGNGAQASHWAGTGTSSGMMNPALALGTRPNVANLDLRALDVIGWDVTSTGANTQINLSTLMAQSKQSLASRLGQSVAWLDANSTQAAQQLGQSRIADITAMVKSSDIYNWGNEDDDPDAFWQKIQNLYNEQGLFATLDELEPPDTLDLAGSTNLDLSALAPDLNARATVIDVPIAGSSAGSTTQPGIKGNLASTAKHKSAHGAAFLPMTSFQPLASGAGFQLNWSGLASATPSGIASTPRTQFSVQFNAQLDSKKIGISATNQTSGDREVTDWGSEDGSTWTF